MLRLRVTPAGLLLTRPLPFCLLAATSGVVLRQRGGKDGDTDSVKSLKVPPYHARVTLTPGSVSMPPATKGDSGLRASGERA